MSYIRDKQTNLLAMPMSLYNIPFLYSYIWIPWHTIHAVPFNIARVNVYSRVRTRLIPVLTLDFSARSERSRTRLLSISCMQDFSIPFGRCSVCVSKSTVRGIQWDRWVSWLKLLLDPLLSNLQRFASGTRPP